MNNLQAQKRVNVAQNKKSWLSILDGSPHKSDLAINSLAAFLLVLVPVIIFEKYTFYLYLTNPQNFFLYSGRRLWFDIIWFAASGVGSAFIIGRKRWIALLIPILGSLAFIVSAYSVPFCDPRECYVSSTDGLGALRDFILFASLGILACSSILAKDIFQSRNKTRIYIVMISTLIGYALSFFPLAHIFAGVSVPFPLNYGQWLLASAIPCFTASFLAMSRGKNDPFLLAFLSGVLGVVFGVVIDYSIPCEACTGYPLSIGAILASGALFSILGTTLASKSLTKFSQRNYSSITIGVVIIFTIVVLLGFFLSTNYEMSVTNSFPQSVASTSFSPLELGTSFVYSGGYLSTNRVVTGGVGVSVNFQNTSIASSPSNFLAAGVGDQSPNCCKDGLDLAYRADAILFSN